VPASPRCRREFRAAVITMPNTEDRNIVYLAEMGSKTSGLFLDGGYTTCLRAVVGPRRAVAKCGLHQISLSQRKQKL
jgi:hypothetical protein